MEKKFFTKNRIKLLFTFGLSGILVLTVSAIYAHSIGNALEAGEKLFECAFQKIFPLYCPGCGGSRSLYYLMRLDIIKSFLYYPALPIAVILIIDLYIRAIASFIRDDISHLKAFRLNSLLIIPIAILLTFVIRNVLLYMGIDYIGDFLGK